MPLHLPEVIDNIFSCIPFKEDTFWHFAKTNRLAFGHSQDKITNCTKEECLELIDNAKQALYEIDNIAITDSEKEICNSYTIALNVVIEYFQRTLPDYKSPQEELFLDNLITLKQGFLLRNGNLEAIDMDKFEERIKLLPLNAVTILMALPVIHNHPEYKRYIKQEFHNRKFFQNAQSQAVYLGYLIKKIFTKDEIFKILFPKINKITKSCVYFFEGLVKHKEYLREFLYYGKPYLSKLYAQLLNRDKAQSLINIFKAFQAENEDFFIQQHLIRYIFLLADNFEDNLSFKANLLLNLVKEDIINANVLEYIDLKSLLLTNLRNYLSYLIHHFIALVPVFKKLYAEDLDFIQFQNQMLNMMRGSETNLAYAKKILTNYPEFFTQDQLKALVPVTESNINNSRGNKIHYLMIYRNLIKAIADASLWQLHHKQNLLIPSNEQNPQLNALYSAFRKDCLCQMFLKRNDLFNGDEILEFLSSCTLELKINLMEYLLNQGQHFLEQKFLEVRQKQSFQDALVNHLRYLLRNGLNNNANEFINLLIKKNEDLITKEFIRAFAGVLIDYPRYVALLFEIAVTKKHLFEPQDKTHLRNILINHADLFDQTILYALADSRLLSFQELITDFRRVCSRLRIVMSRGRNHAPYFIGACNFIHAALYMDPHANIFRFMNNGIFIEAFFLNLELVRPYIKKELFLRFQMSFIRAILEVSNNRNLNQALSEVVTRKMPEIINTVNAVYLRGVNDLPSQFVTTNIREICNQIVTPEATTNTVCNLSFFSGYTRAINTDNPIPASSMFKSSMRNFFDMGKFLYCGIVISVIRGSIAIIIDNENDDSTISTMLSPVIVNLIWIIYQHLFRKDEIFRNCFEKIPVNKCGSILALYLLDVMATYITLTAMQIATDYKTYNDSDNEILTPLYFSLFSQFAGSWMLYMIIEKIESRREALSGDYNIQSDSSLRSDEQATLSLN